MNPYFLSPTFGSFEIDNDVVLPEYVRRFEAPMSADVEMTFECDIDCSMYAKLTGVDLAQGRDCTIASVIFRGPYQVQKKRHRKKRINKKWAKRYGYVTKFKTYHLEDVHIEQDDSDIRFVGRDLIMGD